MAAGGGPSEDARGAAPKRRRERRDTVTDGADALRQFRADTYDLVMLDVEMPVLIGHELCAALRLEAGELLPIVMVTGMDDVPSVDAAYRAGATEFIAKPIS
jgi:DNA-binding response OmpR family regulator